MKAKRSHLTEVECVEPDMEEAIKGVGDKQQNDQTNNNLFRWKLGWVGYQEVPQEMQELTPTFPFFIFTIFIIGAIKQPHLCVRQHSQRPLLRFHCSCTGTADTVHVEPWNQDSEDYNVFLKTLLNNLDRLIYNKMKICGRILEDYQNSCERQGCKYILSVD